jgi:hypothetical protein
MRVASLPKKMKPDIGVEGTDVSPRRALRGGRGQRAPKVVQRNPGYPTGNPRERVNAIGEEITL